MKEDVEELILDLLCKQAVYGLTPEEEKQLAELESETSDDHGSFELTAAAIHMAALGETEEMPASLRKKILDDAGTYVAAPAEEENVFTRPRRPVAPDPVQKGSMWNWLGWVVAAAACIVLAVNLYISNAPTEIVRGPEPTPSPTATATPDLATQRERLLASARDVTRAEWGPGNVPSIKEISGDVVWSDELQEGYMRFRGLPPNDAGTEQYQLWIFDETQPEKTPIDGGVFDVPADGEVIIPIDSRLKARNPSLFAVTIEKPGGVVVSDRKRLAAAAPVVKPGEA